MEGSSRADRGLAGGVLAALLLTLAAILFAVPAAAGDGRRMLDAAEAREWLGVGRVNIAGGRFCTGALISDRLALTAAHCLYNPRTKHRVALSELRFVAGLRLGAHSGARRVVRAATAPGYDYDGAADATRIAMDVALLELDRPISAAEVRAFGVGALRGAGELAIVSYARDRAHAPSIERRCGVVGRSGAVSALDCTATFGASGSPVFIRRPGEPPRLVAVVSAQGSSVAAGRRALTVDVAPHLDMLMTRLQGDELRRAGQEAASRVALAPPPSPRPSDERIELLTR